MSDNQENQNRSVVEEAAAFGYANRDRPIWEVLAELAHGIPEEELEKIPHDGSVNHDHYLYGVPKRVKT